MTSPDSHGHPAPDEDRNATLIGTDNSEQQTIGVPESTDHAAGQTEFLDPELTTGPVQTEDECQTETNEGRKRPVQAALIPALRLPGYTIEAELGRGGMGVVFRARQERPNRLVALKTVHAPQVAGDDQIARFHAEAQAAGQLDHRGIVPVFEVGEHQGIHYFSMGYVDGGSLEQVCRSQILSCRRAAELCEEIAEALAYAHRQGVIHRDIKPHNILIGSDGHPRITDFGLAKLANLNSDLTGTGQIMGTASYMPPEQATGRTADAGPTADVYALGATLYRCVTGRPPFQASSTVEVLRQVVDDEPIPPRRLNQEIEEDLQTIILKCLEKLPANRYQSADDVRDELHRYLSGEPILARPIGRIRRVVRWCVRRPVIAGSLLLGILASFVLAAGIPLLMLQQERLQALEIRRLADKQRDAALLSESRAREAIANAQKIAEEAKAAEERHRRESAESLAKANEARAATQEYHAQIRQVRELRASREPGWTWQGLEILKKASQSPADGKDELELRSLRAELNLTRDIRYVRVKEADENEKDLVWGEGETYYALQISPDGRFLAAAQSRGVPVSSVHLYELPSDLTAMPELKRTLSISTVADKLRSLLKSTGLTSTATPGFRSVQFSHDGRIVAAGTRGGRVAIWNLDDDSSAPAFDVLVSGTEPPGEVRQVEFSPDGQRVYAWVHGENRIHTVSCETGELIGKPIVSVRFAPHPDGTLTVSHESLRRLHPDRPDTVLMAAPNSGTLDQILAWDGHTTVMGFDKSTPVLGNIRSLSSVLEIDDAGGGILSHRPAWLNHKASLFVVPASNDALAIFDALSGEVIGMLPPGTATADAAAICSATGRVLIHSNSKGQVLESRFPRLSVKQRLEVHSSSVKDANAPEYSMVALESDTDVVQRFACTPDQSRIFLAEKTGPESFLIRRLSLDDSTEQSRWTFSAFGLETMHRNHVVGCSLAAMGNSGDVLFAGNSPAGFAACSESGFRLLETPWGPPVAGESESIMPTILTIRFPAVMKVAESIEYRYSVALYLPRALTPGSESITFNVSNSGTSSYGLDGQVLRSKGWYLLQFGSTQAPADTTGLSIEIRSDNLMMTSHSAGVVADDFHHRRQRNPSDSANEVFVQWAALCPAKVSADTRTRVTVGPVAVQTDGVVAAVLDDNKVLRWSSESPTPVTQWEDALNDFAHFGTITASDQTTVVGTDVWLGHMYAFEKLSNDVRPLQRVVRGEYRSSEAIQSLDMTSDASRIVAGNASGELLVCQTPRRQGISTDTDGGSASTPPSPQDPIEPQRFKVHSARVSAVAIHPDGRQLATASSTGEMRLWTITDNRLTQILELKLTNRPIIQLDFAGNDILTLRENDRAVRIVQLPEPGPAQTSKEPSGI